MKKILYDGTNTGDILTFVEGRKFENVTIENKEKKFHFQVIRAREGTTTYEEITISPGQSIMKNEEDCFIVSNE